MKTLKAVLSAAREAVSGTVRRVAAYFLKTVREALKRPVLLPVACALAFVVAYFSPQFAALMALLAVDDPDGHPLTRMCIDIAAMSVLLAIVLVLPELAIALAIVPVASLMNRFADLVRKHLDRETKGEETCMQQEHTPEPCYSLA